MITNVLEYLENAAALYPEKTVFGDEDRSITYQELLTQARAIGSKIAAMGLRRKPVIVGTDHTISCLITFLGVVYSGNFYVPLDLKLPQARLSSIVEVSDAGLLILPEQAVEAAQKFASGRTVITRESLNRTDVDEQRLTDIRASHLDVDPLYLMFTSGSTGVPKGVLISHRSVVDLVEQFAETFSFDEKEVFANQAPFDFDVSVKDIYSTLRNAATMYIVPQKLFSMPAGLVPYLNEHKVTVIIWAVSAMDILSSVKAFDKEYPQYLKKIMFSGEVMPIKVLNYWRSYLPEAMYVNLYGPTEITCNCTYYVVDRSFEIGEMLPIGAAFKNTEILLLDADGHVVPTGESGEICVRGAGVAHGYYRNPEATAAAFTQNPLNQEYPEKIYHTGDFGFYNERNELVFAARRDWQIKHMGHRIELTEVENTAGKLEFIERSCCQYDSEKGRIVMVYQAPERCDREILNGMKEFLPKYMCPNRLIWMRQLPMNARGKIDRVLLRQRFTGDPQQVYKEIVLMDAGEKAAALEAELNAQDLTVRGYTKDTAELRVPTILLYTQENASPAAEFSENPYLLAVYQKAGEDGAMHWFCISPDTREEVLLTSAACDLSAVLEEVKAARLPEKKRRGRV
ncbi:MAG: amino acid adenylation domain-containing protein [Eubacteriales bacterium]|nr:amino acid adenylation domain-containing protein [Eubacteriales bacterium]